MYNHVLYILIYTLNSIHPSVSDSLLGTPIAVFKIPAHLQISLLRWVAMPPNAQPTDQQETFSLGGDCMLFGILMSKKNIGFGMIWMHCFIRPASNVGSCEDGFLL